MPWVSLCGSVWVFLHCCTLALPGQHSSFLKRVQSSNAAGCTEGKCGQRSLVAPERLETENSIFFPISFFLTFNSFSCLNLSTDKLTFNMSTLLFILSTFKFPPPHWISKSIPKLSRVWCKLKHSIIKIKFFPFPTQNITFGLISYYFFHFT